MDATPCRATEQRGGHEACLRHGWSPKQTGREPRRHCMRTTREHSLTRTGRVLLGLMLAAAMGTLAVRSARPAEIIPSIGMTRAVNGGDKVETYGSLGLRGNLVPMVKSEIGVAYRSESRFDN